LEDEDKTLLILNTLSKTYEYFKDTLLLERSLPLFWWDENLNKD